MPRAAKKQHPLAMRLPADDLAIIDRAARLRGRSRTDFVRDAAVRAAEDAIMESALVRMSPRGFAAFMESLGEAPRVVPAMVQVMRRKAPWKAG